MELRNEIAIYIALAAVGVCAVLFFIRFGKRRKYRKGKKVAALEYIKDEPYFKFKVVIFRFVKTLSKLCCMAAIIFSMVLVSRPFVTNVTEKENYSRDIILCMDISQSVDDLNMELVDQLQDTVNKLKGERFGIMIFNTTPVVLCPLTDDYEYVNELLDTIRRAIAARNSYDYDWDDDYWYLYSYITEGTELGWEGKGSSLIADGLASGAYMFPEPEEGEEDRTRILIFSTDNDPCGDSYVTLSQAADICVDKGVIVYGIGTEWMYSYNMTEMKNAVEKTGGTFYLQEDSGTVKEIVKDIEKQGKSLVKGSKEITTTDMPETTIKALIVAICSLFVLSKLIKL